MKLTVKFAFHLFAFIIDAFAVYYDYFVIQLGHQGFGGKFKFLTLWSIVLQTIYFGVTVLVDLTEKVRNPTAASQRNGFQKFRDAFHSAVAFPLATFVVVTFWGLYAVNRELVYPKRLDALIPLWLNHLLHTTILPLIVIDKVVTHHFYPRRLYGILGASGLSLIYLFWILLIAYVDNFWVYPVLQFLKTHERAIFISVCVAVFSLFYMAGEVLTNQIWSKGIQQKSSSQPKAVRNRKPKRKS